MTRDEFEEIYQLAKNIKRLSDYLYTTNKLRANQIENEAVLIMKLIEQEIGQQE